MITGIAVIHGNFGPGIGRPMFGEPVERAKLVLGQGFERKEIQRPAVGVGQKAFQHGQVIDQRFAAGRGCGDDHVPPGPSEIHGLGLVGIQRGDALPDQDIADGPGPRPGRLRVYGILGPDNAVVGDLRLEALGGEQGADIVGYGVFSRGRHKK